MSGRLDAAARAFFALPEAEKLEIAMARGGRAWRGFFPVGAELTSGRPDLQGRPLLRHRARPDDPAVRAGLPLHGPNLFPRQVPELRPAVLEYLDALTARRRRPCCAASRVSLGLDADYFATSYTAEPDRAVPDLPLPAAAAPDTDDWGVGEHTDYGLLTLLAQDDNGGLQVRTPRGLGRRAADPGHVRLQHRRHARPADRRLVPVDAAPGAQPQRPRPAVVPVLLRPRLHAEVPPLPGRAAPATRRPPRWDGQDLRAFTGTYGDYLLGKVAQGLPATGRRGSLNGQPQPCSPSMI